MCEPECVCAPWSVDKGIGSPGPGVTRGCQSAYGCREQNPGPLEEQPLDEVCLQ